MLAANRLVAIVLLKIKYDQGWHETWKEEMQPYVLSDALNVLTAGFGAMALVVRNAYNRRVNGKGVRNMNEGVRTW